MNNGEPTIRVNVDVTNPGQFFACCGLLELADRLWDGAEGTFSLSGSEFRIFCQSDSTNNTASELLRNIANCVISSTMEEEQISRLKKLLNQKKTTLSQHDRGEKLFLRGLWDRERIRLGEPFNVGIDWWTDTLAGGSRFKTWAGKQFVIDLVRGMQSAIQTDSWQSTPSTRWLHEPTQHGSLPFYFDADIGGQSSSIDVGFSLDSLKMKSRTRPLVELAAFVGLQRFRPRHDQTSKTFEYGAWTDPLPPTLASIACNGALQHTTTRHYQFRLLYRTKYLKSFLPSIPVGD
jgi:CRISPR-associated protein Csb3